MRAQARLIWTISARYLLTNRLRLVASGAGVAVGVALATAVAALGSSIDASVREIASVSASRADLEVRPIAHVGLPDEIAGDLYSVAGVRTAGAAIESFTRLRIGAHETSVLLIGGDDGVAQLSPLARPVDIGAAFAEEDPGAIVFGRDGPAGLFEDRPRLDPSGVFVSHTIARELALRPGQRVEVQTPRGWRSVAVNGVSSPGRVAFGEFGAIQDLVGSPGRADVIYVRTDGRPSAVADVQRVIGTRGRVGPTAFRAQEVRDLMGSATILIRLASVAALFVGVFLVSNLMSMSATERIGENGVLRAVGATRRQVLGLVCTEATLIGVVGAASGIAGGALLAKGLLTLRGAGVSDLFPISVTTLALRPVDAVLAGVLGIVAAVVASFMPARRASRVDPVLALAAVGPSEDPAERVRASVVAVGSILAVGGIVLLVVMGRASGVGSFGLGTTVMLTGLALLARPGVPVVMSAALTPLVGNRRGGVARLAIAEALRSPRRTAMTVGAVALALSMVLGVSLATYSFSTSFRSRFEGFLGADLFVLSSSWRPLGADVPLDAGVLDEVLKVRGVQSAYRYRYTTAALGGRAVAIVAFDFGAVSRLQRASTDYRRELARDARLLSTPRTLLVSKSAVAAGYRVGSIVPVPTQAGVEPMRVVGTYEDLSALSPTFYFDFAEFQRVFGSGDADGIPVVVGRADPQRVRARLVDALRRSNRSVVVDNHEEVVVRVNSTVGSFVRLVSTLLLLVLTTAGIGLANTMIVATMQRRREFGVLRAIGMRRGELRRMVVVESLVIGATAVVFAVPIGVTLGYVFVLSASSQFGAQIPFLLPARVFAQSVIVCLVGAVAAGLVPAWRASRLDVVDALRYE